MRLNNEPIFAAREVGSRTASRVRIINPASCFEGARGLVVAIHHEGSILVRLTDNRHAGITIPFGLSEIASADHHRDRDGAIRACKDDHPHA